ncbi:ATPase [Trebonia kvetii]|uniref:ATPase n=1 Tax=Trebonia kvetii TaxID=2480626 RepID=A0A6P2BPJ8_9ACTN|nr:ArsA-related P-loop ATPase [Trebonia kvetii]TVZ00116.1 ATPase [Trebonia kvetii]
MARDTDWDGVRLHVVTGKGGTGKTTVAAALALALAHARRKVLLIETEGRQGIAQLFDRPPLPYEERKIAIAPGEAHDGRDPGGDVYALAIDPEGALLDYLQMFYGMRSAGVALNRLGMVDFATTIAPGLSDVLVTGKATEATRRKQPGTRTGFTYDAVVLDAPPTGRIGRFLNVSAEVSGLAKVGPVRTHADTVANVIKSPQTAVHFVCTLEEMPVQETLDGIAEIRAVPGMQVGGIMINMARPVMLSREELKVQPDLAAMAAALSAAGLYDAESLAGSLADELSEHARLVELADRERSELEAAGPPIYELPLMVEGIDLAALHKLAAELRDQGAA